MESSLVEGDEQPDKPKSQTSMECFNACAAYLLGFVLNTRYYHKAQLQPSSSTEVLHG